MEYHEPDDENCKYGVPSLLYLTSPEPPVVSLEFPDLSFHTDIVVSLEGAVPVPKGSDASYQFCS